jgi:glycosyltransferase involved in cell wall biosynthesis
MPKASIIIPAYNAERWIKTTLQSALAQTWQDKEILLVDDGSTDNTLSIVRKYASPSVKIFKQENQGPGAARNRALREAQGDYIQFLDHDDLLSPEKITEQIKVLQNSPPRMVGISAAIYFYDGTNPDAGQHQEGWPMVDTDDPVEWLIELYGPDGPFSMVPPGAWLTPRSLINEAGWWDELPNPDDDGEYFARVLLASAGIRRSASGFFYFRKHQPGHSLSSTRSEQLQWGAYRSTLLKSEYLLARTNNPRARQAIANSFMRRAFEAYPDYPEITEKALLKVEEFGGTKFVPPFGTWRGQALCKLFGWKATKKLNVYFHRYKRMIRQMGGGFAHVLG